MESTLIRNIGYLHLELIAVLSVGLPALISQIARARPGQSAIQIHCALVSALAMAALALYPSVFFKPVDGISASVLAGFAGGLASYYLDLTLSKKALQAVPGRKNAEPRMPSFAFRNSRFGVPLIHAVADDASSGASDGDRGDNEAHLGIALLLIASAVSEEAIYRGIWLHIADLTESEIAWGAIVLWSVAAYGLLHVFSGWIQASIKMAAGLIFVGLCIGFGSIVPAIIAHVVHNAAYLLHRRWGFL
jgi:membrane protease YdiL (CAAX protease family)